MIVSASNASFSSSKGFCLESMIPQSRRKEDSVIISPFFLWKTNSELLFDRSTFSAIARSAGIGTLRMLLLVLGVSSRKPFPLTNTRFRFTWTVALFTSLMSMESHISPRASPRRSPVAARNQTSK